MRRGLTSGKRVRRLVACGATLSMFATACGPSKPLPTSKPQPPAIPVHRGPLTDYVSAAGLRWMVAGSPRAFAEKPELLSAFERLIPSGRLDAFATGSGVDLRTLSEGCIAGFDYGTIYLARSGKDTSKVRERFEVRLVSDAIRKSPTAGVWRVTGLIGNTPESLLTIDDDFIGIAVGDPLLVRVAESFALGKFKRTSPALLGASLSTLPRELEQAPLRFYAPGPFPETWARGVEGLFARAYAVGASVSFDTGTILKLHIVVSGAFGPDIEESRSRILKTWDTLLASPVGHLLELQRAIEAGSFGLDVRDERADLTVAVNAETLVQGLSAAVEADTRALFDWSPK